MTQHHSALAHHFETLEQQKEAATLGMWAFLATEVMLFGGVFAAYIVYRLAYPEVFIEGANHLNLLLGTVNTVVLLCSSLTVALAVNAIEHGKRMRTVGLLLVTIVLGLTFLGIKAVEYGEKFVKCAEPDTKECMVPGQWFKWEPVPPQAPVLWSITGKTEHGTAAHGEEEQLRGSAEKQIGPATPFPLEPIPPGQTRGPADVHQIFFVVYFTATGLHAFHMIVGSIIIAVLAWMSWKGRFSPEYYTPVELGGLYWHLIDIVWVFLFPLLYLIH